MEVSVRSQRYAPKSQSLLPQITGSAKVIVIPSVTAYILQGGLCAVLQTQMDGKLSHRRSHQIGRWLCRVNTSWTGLVPYIADQITYIISWAITPIQSLSIIGNCLTETNVSLKIWKFLINWRKKPRYFTGIILELEKNPWSTIVHNSCRKDHTISFKG